MLQVPEFVLIILVCPVLILALLGGLQHHLGRFPLNKTASDSPYYTPAALLTRISSTMSLD